MNPVEILEKYAAGTIGPAEKKAFEQWLQTLTEPEYHQLLLTYEQVMIKDDAARPFDPALLDAISRRIASHEQQVAAEEAAAGGASGARIIPLASRKLWLRVAAASIILLAGLGITLAIVNAGRKGKTGAANGGLVVSHDINAPVSTHATLTLANGAAIVLDTAGNGSLAVQGATNVVKLDDGQIRYAPSESISDRSGSLHRGTNGDIGGKNAILYNSFSVPRGSKVISLQMSDGTRVWLNSESTLRFPVNFAAHERRVVITGEAYFEVARDPARKFLVVSGNTTTEVLGTHFNVNAYEEKPETRVTLLEGKVKVHSDVAERLITPGEQAAVKADGAISSVKKTDTDAVMAWKNGLFNFTDEDLQSVMAQIRRWYNVDIAYEGKIKPLNFGGVVSRRANVSNVLDLLALTGTVKFRIEPPVDAKTTGKVVVIL